MEDEDKAPGRNRISCLEPERWLDLAAGLLPPEKAARMLAHAADCNDCAQRLQQAVRVLAPDDSQETADAIGSLASSTPEWRTRTAAALAQESRLKRGPQFAWRWLAAAAALLLFSGVALYLRSRANRAPLEALAAAYSLERNVELRIPGAAYAPMAPSERGSVKGPPAELLESEAAINRHLDRVPMDADWLQAEARADILEGRPEKAIDSLKLALSSADSSGARATAAIYLDLGTAYFQMAQAAHGQIDYSAALDALGRSMQIAPSDPVAYFNRAIVNERAHNYDLALADWKKYLELDPSGSWANEARSRMEKLRQVIGGIRIDDPLRLDQSVEHQLEKAMEAGLPRTGESLALAARLESQNGDRWLADALRADGNQPVATLASMVAAHSSYDLDRFPNELEQLNRVDSSHLSQPLRVWLQFERLYRVSNSPNAATCLPGADGLIEVCRSAGYSWFLLQTVLEKSTCRYTAGDIAGATTLSREAVEIARDHQFPSAQLRAEGFLGVRLVTAGLYREAAELDAQGLDQFWSGQFSLIRAQNFYNNELLADEALGRFFAAQAAVAMSSRIAELAGMNVTHAVANARWAEFDERTGMHDEAVRHWNLSREIFRKVARNATSDEFRAYAESHAAETSQDRNTLLNLEPAIRSNTNPMVVVPYLVAMARMDRRDGRAGDSEANLSRAAEWLARQPEALPNGARLRRWRAELDQVYREWTGVMLERKDSAAAYRTWQQFLAADSAILGQTARVAADASLPATVLTYSRLGGRYAAWLHDGNSANFRWIEPDAETIDRLVSRYIVLCSDRRFDWSVSRTAGSLLYAYLIAPFLASGKFPRALLIQPDGELFRLPWNSLFAGLQPLGSLTQVAVTPLPVANSAGLPTVRPSGQATVVADAEIAESRLRDYPPLPDLDKEIQAVRSTLPSAVVLRGRQATGRNIDAALSAADVFHFAGHSATLPDGARLLVTPDESSPDGLWWPRERMSSCRVAILSACSTGRYEETDSTDPHDLAQAFLLGGATEVVASQWPVDSAVTAEFMRQFYQSLRDGADVSRALQLASAGIQRSPEWRHPYYWAAFTLYIHPASVSERTK